QRSAVNGVAGSDAEHLAVDALLEQELALIIRIIESGGERQVAAAEISADRFIEGSVEENGIDKVVLFALILGGTDRQGNDCRNNSGNERRHGEFPFVSSRRKYFRSSSMMVPSVRGAKRRSLPNGTGVAAGAALAFNV